jgi:hypothetical protein
MVSFNDLTISQLKAIARQYNVHKLIKLSGKKTDLVEGLNKHLFIDSDYMVKLRTDSKEFNIPLSRKQQRDYIKEYQLLKRNPDILQGINKERIDFYENIMKEYKPTKKQLKKNEELIKKNIEELDKSNKLPEEYNKFIELSRELKEYKKKYFGTNKEPNEKYIEYTNNIKKMRKDFEEINNIIPNNKINLMDIINLKTSNKNIMTNKNKYLNKLKKKYNVKTNNELLRLYKKVEDYIDETLLIKELYGTQEYLNYIKLISFKGFSCR